MIKKSSSGILYGNCKVQKTVPVDEFSPLRPIISAIDTPFYNLSKYLVPVLSPLTSHKFVTKDSFSFAFVMHFLFRDDDNPRRAN